ncbi:MAG: hypothetical protein JOZ84_11790 [Methylobacteriaceae bacterium]|nr:hypothetical protein [Methylobacteriaceae bacterium]
MTSSAFVGEWKPIATAPQDGTLVLVAIRESEQGPAQVDVARWAKPARGHEKCWVSADSAPDCPIIYSEGELAFWMPLPTSLPRSSSGAIAASELPQVPGEIEGSGI